jgi:Ankyrin repeats (3 copies)
MAMTAADPSLPTRLTQGEQAALVRTAGEGSPTAVALMLDLGFPADVRDEEGATPLHASAYAGGAETVQLLLSRGADIEALDGQWQSSPLEWAVVGSGYRPATSQNPDWVGTVRMLLDAGASTQGISLTPDDSKPPSAEVAELLREYGAGTG